MYVLMYLFILWESQVCSAKNKTKLRVNFKFNIKYKSVKLSVWKQTRCMEIVPFFILVEVNFFQPTYWLLNKLQFQPIECAVCKWQVFEREKISYIKKDFKKYLKESVLICLCIKIKRNFLLECRRIRKRWK